MRLATILSLMLLVIAGAAYGQEDYPAGDLQPLTTYAFGSPVSNPTFVEAMDYSNITNFLGLGVAQGPSALQGANQITRLIADDLTPNGVNAGASVTRHVFSVANLNQVAVTVRARTRFWFDNGGVPGTYYNVPAAVGFTFNPLTFQPGVTLVNGGLPANSFTMPGTTFWAGVTFDNNNGATGATPAQMDAMGQGVFDPPTIGSSNDVIFITDSAGSFFNISNPAGATNDLGSDPANLGHELVVDVPVPAEKSSWGRVKKLYR